MSTQDKIQWKGLFSQMPNSGRQAKGLLTDFLEQANLICDGMSIVAYEQDGEADVAVGAIDIVAVPNHYNHVDLLLGLGGFNSHTKVRVMWHCDGIFPRAMGIPTRKRLEAAVDEFYETGMVTTKYDDLTPIPAAGAELYLHGRALLERHMPRQAWPPTEANFVR